MVVVESKEIPYFEDRYMIGICNLNNGHRRYNMICPKCKTEFREGYTKCSDCGEDLISNNTPKQSEGGDWLFNFGETTAKRAVSILFFLGLFPMLYKSIFFGRYLYLTNSYLKSISFLQNGQNVHSGYLVNNLPLGILGGFVLFIVMVLMWKVLCELLIIIFRAIETYTEKNKIH
jgi:hypothetical protein